MGKVVDVSQRELAKAPCLAAVMSVSSRGQHQADLVQADASSFHQRRQCGLRAPLPRARRVHLRREGALPPARPHLRGAGVLRRAELRAARAHQQDGDDAVAVADLGDGAQRAQGYSLVIGLMA